MKIAVLSRGYKRKSSGYVLACNETTMTEIGDEPFQMHQKFPDIYVAVDAKRVRGIERLQADAETQDVDVVLLDDAFQHRYVKPGINILLVDITDSSSTIRCFLQEDYASLSAVRIAPTSLS